MGRIKKFNEHINEGAPSDNSDYLHNIKFITKGDKEAAELATKTVGDGKDPNHFFVVASNDYMYFKDDIMTAYSDNQKDAPVKVEDRIEVETFGPFSEYVEARKKADDLELSETVGPRYVMIEDRKTGTIYEKFLIAQQKVSWSDEVNDSSKNFGYSK